MLPNTHAFTLGLWILTKDVHFNIPLSLEFGKINLYPISGSIHAINFIYIIYILLLIRMTTVVSETYILFFLNLFLGLYLQYVEVSRLGAEMEL